MYVTIYKMNKICLNQGKDKKWLLKTGDPLIQVHLLYTLYFGSREPEKVAA